MNKARKDRSDDCSKLLSITAITAFSILPVFLLSSVIAPNYHKALAFTPAPVPSDNVTALDVNRPSFLKVIIRVDNTGGGTAKPSDFTAQILADNDPNPGLATGSENGTIVAMTGSGTYGINMIQYNKSVPTYGVSFSGDCKLTPEKLTLAGGTINSGDKQTCIITMIFPGF